MEELEPDPRALSPTQDLAFLPASKEVSLVITSSPSWWSRKRCTRNWTSSVGSFGFAVWAPLRFTMRLWYVHYKVGTSLLWGLRRSIMPRSGRGGSDSTAHPQL